MEAQVGWHFASKRLDSGGPGARTPEQAVAESAAVSWLFGTCGLAAGLGSAMFLTEVHQGAGAIRLAKGVLWLAFAALSLYLLMRRKRRTGGLVTLFGLLAVTCLVISSAIEGYGLRAPGMMCVPLFVHAIAVLGSTKRTVFVTAWAILCILGLGFGQPPMDDQHSIYPPNHSAIILGVIFIVMAAGLGHAYAGVIQNQIDLASVQARRLQQLIEQLPVGVMVHEGGRVRDMNPKARALFDLAPGDVVAGIDLDRLTRHAQPLDGSPEIGLFDQHRSSPVRFDLQRPAGDFRTLESMSITMEDAASAGILTVLTDQTERVQAQDALLEQKLTLASILEFSPLTVVLMEEDTGAVRVVNAAAEDLFGLPRASLLGQNIFHLPVWRKPGLQERLQATLAREDSAYKIAASAYGVDRTDLTLEFAARRVSVGGRAHILLMGQDVTRERALRRELLAVTNTSLIGVCVVRHGRATLCNDRFENMMGWPSGTGPGRTMRETFTEASRAEFRAQHVSALKAGEQIEVHWPIRRADGRVATGRFLGQLIEPGARDGFAMVWLCEDITDVLERQALLEQARTDSESSRLAMGKILAEMSHEIRAPLHEVVGLSQLIGDPSLSTVQRQDYLRLLDGSIESLSHVVDDVLDLSTMESGKAQAECQPLDVVGLLKDLRDAFASKAQDRGLRFELQIDPELPRHILGDGTRLRQILKHYLANALKDTTQGQLTLAARPVEEFRMRLTVEDTGPGLSAEQQALLFQPLPHARPREGRAQTGMGLGLYIHRQSAALMGGQVGVCSAPGRGSRFWVDIPAQPIASVNDDRTAIADAPPSAKALAGLKVLAAEDNPVSMLVLERLLSRQGAKVVQVGNGLQAVHEVMQAHRAGQPFDVVVMDIGMPAMDGLEAVRRLRQMPEGRALPVVALAASVTPADRHEAFAAGMSDFIAKPLHAAKLVSSILHIHRPADLQSSPSPKGAA